jgi:hypothetical protein
MTQRPTANQIEAQKLRDAALWSEELRRAQHAKLMHIAYVVVTGKPLPSLYLVSDRNGPELVAEAIRARVQEVG